ncbi:g610 [Coccomyxa elongata]
MTSAKTGSVRMLLEHFRNLFPKIDPLLDFHLGRKFRDKRFTRFCGSKRVIHRLCKAITKGDGEKTLVGFGDWSNIDTGGFIQGAPAGPVNPLKRELRRHCKVVSVDEHLTSKLCQFCGQRTRNMMRRVESEGSGGEDKSRGVRHLDLSTPAFTQIAEEEAGVVDILVQQIDCPDDSVTGVSWSSWEQKYGQSIQDWSKSRSNVNEIASVEGACNAAVEGATYTAQLADDAAKVLNRTGELPIGPKYAAQNGLNATNIGKT